MKHQELAEQNQMENECSLSLSLSFKYPPGREFQLGFKYLPSTSPKFTSAKVITLSYHSIILSKLTSTYIITIIMSFLTSIRASSRQAIRTNFAVPASTFHFSAVRSLKEDDSGQYIINPSHQAIPTNHDQAVRTSPTTMNPTSKKASRAPRRARESGRLS